MVEMGNKYYAFISYKREDEEWAKWIQYEFEHYHLPSTLNGREDLPKEFRPVFRDTDELSAGNLPAQISDALDKSANLIVVCSPQAAQSEWVNREILNFIESGKRKGVDNISKVFPLIVKGVPYSAEASTECFPNVLRNLPLEKERIGANVNETGRDKAFIKIMAGTLNVNFDLLWNRYEKEKIEEERRRREERNKLLLAQSRFLAEKAVNLITEGDSYKARLLLLEALPKRLDDPNDRPWSPEAEAAFRLADEDMSAILRGHPGRVESVAYNSNASLIASVGGGKAIVWDVMTGNKIREFKGYNFVTFSPDGEILLTVSYCDVWLWNIKNGDLLYTFTFNNINSALFSPDGNKIVLAGYNVIYVLDAIGRKILLKIVVNDDNHVDYDNRVNYASFSPDGKKIVSASSDETVRIWDANYGSELCKFIRQPGVNTVVFRPDGRRVLCASSISILWELSVESGEKLSEFFWHTRGINSASYNTDGTLIVSASDDGTIRVWDTDTRREMYVSEKQPGSVYVALFGSNNFEVVIGGWDGTVRILNINYYACEWLYDGVPIIGTVASFSSDGRRIAYVTDSKIIGVFDVEERKEELRFNGHTESITDVKFSPDNQLLLSASWDKSVRLWNISTGKLIHVFRGHTGAVMSVSFSPDGGKIISISLDRTVIIWDAMNGKMLWKLNGTYSSRALPTMFSPDGKLFLTCNNASIEIWNAAQRFELLNTISVPFYIEPPMAFSPDSRLIVTPTVPSEGLQIWDATTGKEVGNKLNGHEGDVTSISFSPDGTLLATSSIDKTIRIWNIADGEKIHVLVGHSSGVTKVSFSPDGKRLFSTSIDGTAMIWDIKSGKVLKTIKYSVTPYGTSVLFSPCGNYVIFLHPDSLAYLKEIEPLQKLMDRCRKRFKNRSLTPEERKMYYLE